MKALISSLILAVILAASPTQAVSLHKVAQPVRYWGTFNSVAISGDYAYTVTANGLSTIDISDLANPRLVGDQHLAVTGYLNVAGDRLYNSYGDLETYSLADPSRPSLISTVSLLYPSRSVRVRNGRLGVTCDQWISDRGQDYLSGAFYFLNAQDPRQGVRIITSDLLYSGFDWNDSYLYLKAGNIGPYDAIQVWDITDLNHARQLGWFPGAYSDFLLCQDRLIMVTDTSLRSWSLENPAAPSDPKAFPEFPDSVIGKLTLKSSTLFVTASNFLYAYDVTDAADPQFISRCDVPVYSSLIIDGAKAALASDSNLYFVDASDLHHLDIASTLSGVGSAVNIRYSADKVTLAAGADGVHLYSVENPAAPNNLSHIERAEAVSDAVSSGDYIYLLSGSHSLLTYDISNLNNPVLTDSIHGTFYSLNIYQNFLYATSNSFCVYNLNDPAHPSLVYVHQNVIGGAVQIEFPRLVLTPIGSYYQGPWIADISIPDQPQFQQLPTCVGGFIQGLRYEVVGSYGIEITYFYDWEMGADPSDEKLRIFDITSLDNPSILDSVQLDVNASYRLFHAGSLLGININGSGYLYDPTRIVRDHALTPVADFGADKSPTSAIAVDSLLYTVNGGALNIYDFAAFLSAPTSSPDFHPSSFALHPCFPSPFNSSTTISSLPSESTSTSLRVFDTKGRLVEDLSDRFGNLSYRAAGEHKVLWNAGDLGAGIYFVRLASRNHQLTQKVILLK